MTSFIRGQVYWATFDHDVGRKPWLVVSNNGRNRSLSVVLVARITTTFKRPLKSIVELPPGECVTGRVLCDEITPMYETDAPVLAGALSPGAMRRVDAALAVALGIS